MRDSVKGFGWMVWLKGTPTWRDSSLAKILVAVSPALSRKSRASTTSSIERV